MRTVYRILGLVAALLTAGGCDRAPSSALPPSPPPATVPSAVTATTKPEIPATAPSPADAFAMRRAALAHQMSRFAANGVDQKMGVTYVVDDAALAATFAGHAPPVVAAADVKLVPTENAGGIGVNNQRTGKPAIMWTVEAVEVRGDLGLASVGWWASGRGSGINPVRLTRNRDGTWRVTAVERGPIS